MSLKTGMATVAQASSRYWGGRNLREQRMLLAAFALTGIWAWITAMMPTTMSGAVP